MEVLPAPEEPILRIGTNLEIIGIVLYHTEAINRILFIEKAMN
jgi:hypothetical protein